MRPAQVLCVIPGLLAAAFVVAVGFFPGTGIAYVDGPPPAVTGGFGEKTCHECHYDYGLNDKTGTLTLQGIPESYTAGETYTITIELAHPRMQRGGFELSARYSKDGGQAGVLSSTDEHVEVVPGEGTSIQYARQTRSGSAPQEKGLTRWSLRWQAPMDGQGQVTFNVAANAANFDDSPFGDFPYAASAISGGCCAAGATFERTESGGRF